MRSSRDATDRQQDHVRRRDAEGACREDVSEFVQQHAQKQQHHEHERAPGRRQASREVIHAENPNKKQQERHVDADRRACDRSGRYRPAHGNLLETASRGNLTPITVF
jgi:hypothetical protein